MFAKQLIPATTRRWIKGRLMNILGLPWNSYGVPIPLMSSISTDHPITIIDVGASEGLFTDSIRKYCGIKNGLLIEAQPRRAEEIRRLLPTCKVVPMAVSDIPGSIEMEVLNWDFSSSILPIRRDMPEVSSLIDMRVRERITVPTDTLDNICAANQFDDPVDLLKIDVQGAEFQVISGAEKTLQRTRLLWMELSINPVYIGVVGIESMISTLKKQGFILRHIQEGFHSATGELMETDALFVRSPS